MKVCFDHIEGFGKVKDIDFIYSNPYGVLEHEESAADALKSGWIPWGQYWYNLRSVRIDLKLYQPTETVKKLSKKITYLSGNLETKLDVYLELYESYCKHHGFERNIEWDNFKDCKVIEYHFEEKLAGISLYKIIENQFVAMQFIWNYADPKLSLGNIAQMIECKLAKLNGCHHVYILGGYEHCCIYKSSFRGFEFWTGKEWSQDVELYKALTMRDEKAVVIIPELEYENI
jgi:arginyl-tRNA--protein-N-Asp/Glu arginylyltransferase